MELLNRITRLYKDLWLELIFPKRCFGCKRFSTYLCSQCFVKIEKISIQRCIICQKPSLHGFTHPKCKTRYSPERLISFFPYQDKIVSTLIKTGKYQFIPDIFNEMAVHTAQLFKNNINGISLYKLASIPLHKKKQRWRGFNQAEIITQVYKEQFNIQLQLGLNRSSFTKPQKDLNANQRKTNLKNVFAFSSEEIIAERIILIDDIITTGSTFTQASQALKKAGAKEIVCVAIAQD